MYSHEDLVDPSFPSPSNHGRANRAAVQGNIQINTEERSGYDPARHGEQLMRNPPTKLKPSNSY